MQTLIKNGTIVNAGGRARLDVLVEAGRIISLGQNLAAAGAKIIDAKGCYVLPGFIDTHTHFDLDTGSAVTADDFVTGTKAAALGGTTCVLDFATQEREGSLQKALAQWHEKARGSSCNYGFHMAIARWDEGVRREMTAMCEQGVTSYKMYMVYDALRVDDGQIFQALQEAARLGSLIGVHCENWDVLLQMVRQVKESGITAPYGHPLSRPAAIEAEAVNRFLRIAQLAHAPAYVVHLSTAQGLDEARRARARGQKVFLETCPQYLLLTDQRYQDADGAKFVMSPPLRKSWDNESLWQGLHVGEIDTIGTDHCSFTMAQKAMGKDDFSKIPNGAPGVQHRGQLLYTYGVCEGRLSLERMVALLSTNAARLFGMPDHGQIAQGKAADLLVWDPSYTGRITDTNHAHNCDNSPYAGFAVQGRARDVLVGGELVVEAGAFLCAGQGKYIHRSRCIID
ncbi:MAG: dihydropyrimidinase [Candidatus Pelethousia sp.]|nr:dihydropyrimidinase [Candidatus Pelethousia sp.]